MPRLHELWHDLNDAASSLRRRPGRSALSCLGVAIGVVALVSMLSIGEGAKREALRSIASLGMDTIRLESAPPDGPHAGVDLRNRSLGLNLDDAEQLQVWLGARGSLGYFVRRDQIPVQLAGRSMLATVIGVSESWPQLEALRTARGRPLLPDDAERRRRVCLLGADLALQLRASAGSSLRLRRSGCEVTGILQPSPRLLTEGTGLSALDFNRLVVMPYQVFPWRDGQHRTVHGMVARLSPRSVSELPVVAASFDQILREAHHGVADYRLVVPRSLLEEAQQTQRLFQLVMGSIAGLSLLVGGIGVMNIMLANISEQTREIGLRMAIGATRARIVSLYLCHAVLLCFAGGVLGMLVGVAAALLVQGYAGWHVAFSAFGLMTGPLSAAATGVLFGLHPALRAARLNPAIALRET